VALLGVLDVAEDHRVGADLEADAETLDPLELPVQRFQMFKELKMLLPVSFYGGYFGAGIGIMMLGVFSLATGGDYRSANVTKNFVTSLNGIVAATIFISQGAVVWPQTLSLMVGMIGGGLLGAYVARIIPRKLVRVLIVLFGAALTVAFARRYWF